MEFGYLHTRHLMKRDKLTYLALYTYTEERGSSEAQVRRIKNSQTNISSSMIPSKHDSYSQCLFTAGPASTDGGPTKFCETVMCFVKSFSQLHFFCVIGLNCIE